MAGSDRVVCVLMKDGTERFFETAWFETNENAVRVMREDELIARFTSDEITGAFLASAVNKTAEGYEINGTDGRRFIVTLKPPAGGQEGEEQ